ncbi:hypothetical protein LSAT2_023086 [Lamellibrachia satsuma]|nr:hypothetical protein LSAT2_023086 [Lamellibrachia satsuma]
MTSSLWCRNAATHSSRLVAEATAVCQWTTTQQRGNAPRHASDSRIVAGKRTRDESLVQSSAYGRPLDRLARRISELVEEARLGTPAVITQAGHFAVVTQVCNILKPRR